MGERASHWIKMGDMREMEGFHVNMGEQTPCAHSGNLVEETASEHLHTLVT